MADGVDATVHRKQAAGLEAPLDGTRADLERAGLGDGDHAVLAPCQLGESPPAG